MHSILYITTWMVLKVLNPTKCWLIWFDLLCLASLSAKFQLYHVDQFMWWKKPEYPERTTDYGQATGNLYHLQLRVECTFYCNLQSRARTHAVLVIGLYELLGNPTTQPIEPPGPSPNVEKSNVIQCYLSRIIFRTECALLIG
jgi:hypothetical protein